MKKILFVLLVVTFISQTNLAQNCWPSFWTKSLTQHSYTYKIIWPGSFGQMFYGQALSYQQIQSNISSCVASAFSEWGNATNITISPTTGTPDFPVSFDSLAGRAGTCSGNNPQFDLTSHV